MNRLGLLALILGASAAWLILSAPHAAATTNCGLPNANVCHGDAMVGTVTGGVTSGRCFWWLSVNSAPACTAAGIGTTANQVYEMQAGACVTLYYFDVANGAVPPGVPNKVTLSIKLDNAATVIRTVLSAGAEPANGASTSICATDTGVAGGANRAGTYRIYLNPVKDNGPAGVGNYNIDSDGTATVGAIASRDAGMLLGDLFCVTVSRSAYPADSTFAYGTAGDEQVTVTSTFTQPNGNNGREKLDDGVGATDLASWFKTGTSTEVAGTTSLAQSFTIDNVMTTNMALPFVQTTANNLLSNEPWSRFAASGNGAGLTIVDGGTTRALCYDGAFSVDASIKLDSDGTHSFAAADETVIAKVGSSSGAVATLYNKGETVYYEWFILNARGEQLSRSMSFVREDSANTVCQSIGSLSPTANKYSTTSTLNTGATCLTSADTTGLLRRLQVTNTNQNYQSGTIFLVSSLLRFDTDGTGSVDNLVKECLTTCPSTDIPLFNRGETVDCEGYLILARGGQYSNAAAIWVAKASDATTTNSQTPSLSAGKYSCAAYALSSSEKATADTTGDPHTYMATADGNTATTSSPDFSVSSLYFIDAHIQLGSTLVKDDFPTENANEATAYIISNAQTDTTHGWCHVKGVRKDVEIDTSGSAVAWSYIDPLTATRFSGTTDTASDGWTATHLDLLASTPLGTWTFRCTVAAFQGNAGTNDQAFTVSVPTGTGGGFPGDPLRLLCAPIIANPSETVTCTASENNADGSARTGNTAGTLYDLWNPAYTQIVTGGAVTEIGTTGNYRWTYSPGGSPTLGNYIFVVRTTDASPVSSSTVITIETDPTVALANSLATILTNQGTSATQVSGVATQVSGVQSTVTEIDTDADEILAGQATALAQATTYHDNETANLGEVHTDVHEAIALLQSLNITITGNFTTDNATLHSILDNLTAHRVNSMEIFGMDFNGATFGQYLIAASWLIALLWCFTRGKLLAGTVASIGAVVGFITGTTWVLAAMVALFIAAVFLEAFARERIYQRFLNITERNP